MTTNLDTRIFDDPHYADGRFRVLQPIWGTQNASVEKYYLFDKHPKVCRKVKAKEHTARWYKEYLEVVLKREVTLKYILVQISQIGLPYYVLGYS